MRLKKPESTSPVTPRLIRMPQVMDLVGLKKTAIYAAMAEKGGQGFPAPVRIGNRAVAWREHEVLAWIESRTKTNTQGGEA